MIHFLNKHRTIFISVTLALIIFLGLYFRFIYAFEVEFTNQYRGTEFTQDEYNYINLVSNLLSDQTYGFSETPDAQVMPGYPIFLAMIMVIFGTGSAGVFAVQILQALVSTGTIYLVYLLATKMLNNRGAGLIAATLIAFYSPLILYSRFILPETLYIFFIALYFLIQIKALEKEESAYHIGAGVLLGVSVLFKPMIFVLLPLPYIYLFVKNKDHDDRILFVRNFVFFAVACSVILVPWWIRNIITLERFVLLSDNAGAFYYGIVRNYDALPMANSYLGDGMRLLGSELLNRPLETLIWFTFGKLGVLFVEPAFYLPPDFTLLSGFSGSIHMYIVALGSIGLISGLFINRLRMMSIFIGAYILLSLLFIPASRYGLQYIPFLAIFAVYALFKIMSRTRVIIRRDDNFINSESGTDPIEKIILE